jgi:hypothetical protein
MTALCFIDTETTGVHPERQVWEVAMIRREGDKQQGATFFVDVDLSNADPFGLQVGRFYDRHPVGRWLSNKGGPSELPKGSDAGPHLDRATAARVVARFTHGAHLVGAVPNFDSETLAPLLREHGLTPAWHYHLIDVEALAVGYLWGKSPHMMCEPPWKSDILARECGVEPPSDDERHTALGDARWAMRWYDAITGTEGR